MDNKSNYTESKFSHERTERIGKGLTRRNSRKGSRRQIKSIDDFSVKGPPSPDPSLPDSEGHAEREKHKFVISDLVAQRFAR